MRSEPGRAVGLCVVAALILAGACGSPAAAPSDAGADASVAEASAIDASLPDAASPEASPPPDASSAAEPFFFGVESLSAKIDTAPRAAADDAALRVVESELGARYVKIRLAAQPTEPFTSRSCQPDCFDLDATVRAFKDKGWSMVPMISAPSGPGVTSVNVAGYVKFVEWFLGKYRGDARIEYLELVNHPAGLGWRGTDDDLVAIQNGVYDTVHRLFPGVKVGTHGIELFADAPTPDAERQRAVLELLLDPARGARFDFLAFHGYKPLGEDGPYPPTRSTLHNPYAPITGVLELRKRLDANGWTDRGLLDTESTYMSPLDTLASWGATSGALMAQSLVMKRALVASGRPALLGMLPLKVSPRCEPGMGECGWADLAPDGAVTPAVRAVAVLTAKLGGVRYAGHISGRIDVDDEAWVERFDAPSLDARAAIYVAWKPFASTGRPALDDATLPYTLDLGGLPRAVRRTDMSGVVADLPAAPRVPLALTYAPVVIEVTR